MKFNFYYNITSAVLLLVAYLTIPEDLDNQFIKKRKEWEKKNLINKKKMPLMRYLDHRIEHIPMAGHNPLAYPAL